MKVSTAPIAALALILYACSAAEEPAGEPGGGVDAKLPAVLLYMEPAVLRKVETEHISGLLAKESAATYRVKPEGNLHQMAEKLADAFSIELSSLERSQLELDSSSDEGSGQVILGSEDSRHLVVHSDGAWHYAYEGQEDGSLCRKEANIEENMCGPHETRHEDALAVIGALAAKLQVDLSDFVFEPEVNPPGATHVEASLRFEDAPSGVNFGFWFSETGRLSKAHGNLVVFEKAGDYPLVNIEETAVRAAGRVPEPHLTGGAFRPVAADLAWSLTEDVEGSWWLLPGYTFETPYGRTYFETALAEPNVRWFLEGEYDPDQVARERLENLTDLVVGMPEVDALRVLSDAGAAWRIARKDGVWLAVTMDFNPDRLNLHVEGGTVKLVTFG